MEIRIVIQRYVVTKINKMFNNFKIDLLSTCTISRYHTKIKNRDMCIEKMELYEYNYKNYGIISIAFA